MESLKLILNKLPLFHGFFRISQWRYPGTNCKISGSWPHPIANRKANMVKNYHSKYAAKWKIRWRCAAAKTYTADFLEKKVKKNRGEVKQYYITDNHPAIIPRDIFQEVQLEIARRSSKRKVSCRRTKSGRGKYTSKYALSERTVCGECGAMYRRTMWIKRDRTKEDVWRCVNRLEFGTKYCKHSPSLKEPIYTKQFWTAFSPYFIIKKK